MASADRVNPLSVVQFPFAGGIDEASRDELVEPGQGWASLVNGRQSQRGGYSTRNGFTALSSVRLDAGATSATAGYKVFADRGSVVRIADTLKAETYSPQAGTWLSIGRVCEATYTTTELPTLGNGTSTFAVIATAEDIEYCNGYLAVVTQGSTEASAMVLDASTLAPVIQAGTLGATTIRPLVASYGGRYFGALSVMPARIEIQFCDTNSATTLLGGFLTASSIATTTTYANKAVAICSLTDRIAIAWINNSAGTNRVTVETYDVTGLRETTTINTSSVTPAGLGLACYQGTGTLFVTWNEGVSVKMCGLTYNSLATVLATTATVLTVSSGTELIGLSPSSATAGKIISNDGVAADVRVHTRGYATTAGAVVTSGSQITIYGANHCSRPFYLNSRHYVQVFGGASDYPVDAGNTQKTLILVDWTDAAAILRPVVNLTPGLAVNSFYGKCKTVAGATSTTLYGVASIARSSQANVTTIVTYDFADRKRWQTAAFGNSTFLGGGVPS